MNSHNHYHSSYYWSATVNLYWLRDLEIWNKGIHYQNCESVYSSVQQVWIGNDWYACQCCPVG